MKLAFELLLLLLVAALSICKGSNVNCDGVNGFFDLPEDQSSYITYEYEADTTDPANPLCTSVTQMCYATIDNDDLRQRVWFLTSTKNGGGSFYKPTWIQNYNIQCPPKTVLHLFPQFLDTESAVNDVCDGFDTVTVTAGGFSEVLCGGEAARQRSLLYNEGLGTIFLGGNATVEFCSNSRNALNQGFVIRAICIDPSATLIPFCEDFNQVRMTEKGKEFIDRVNKPFADPIKTNILHKRSSGMADLSNREASILKLLMSGNMKRHKRFVTGVTVIDLQEGQVVRYVSENMLTIDFNNGTISGPFDVKWLVINSECLGTRIFDGEAPSFLTLEGPGRVEIFDGMAFLLHTVSEDRIPELLIRSFEIMTIINNITSYFFNNYIEPYPIICPPSNTSLNFPLPRATGTTAQDPRYRSIDQLDFVREKIENGTCYRAVRINDTPARNSLAESNILEFCAHFFDSCDAILRAVCYEALGYRVG